MLPLGLLQSLGPWAGLFNQSFGNQFGSQGQMPFGFSQPTLTPQAQPAAQTQQAQQQPGIGLLPQSGGTTGGGGISPQNIIGSLLSAGKGGLGLFNMLGGSAPSWLGQGLGAAGGLFNLGSGIAGKNPAQALGGAANLGLTGAQMAGLTSPALSAIGSVAGPLLSAIAGGLGGRPNPNAGMTSALGSAASAAAGVGGATAAAAGAVAAPFTAALAAYLGMPGVMSPTEAWMNFGHHLGKTLGSEDLALQNLPQVLDPSKIKTKQDLADVIGGFKWAIERGGVGGYSQSGPWNQIAELPGATGTGHEWKQYANYNQTTAALNQLFAKMAEQLPGDAPTVVTPNYGDPRSYGTPLFRWATQTLNPKWFPMSGGQDPYNQTWFHPTYDPATDTFTGMPPGGATPGQTSASQQEQLNALNIGGG